jgi:hypothetical protein
MATTLSRLKSDPEGMASRILVQLVAPGSGGVRDYLNCLRQGWLTQGLATEVLELSASLASQTSLATRLHLLSEQGDVPCTLLIHFSGYGYHPRGLCGWLVREVQAARRALGSQLHVVTMFHELFATGPPWRSAFWLSRLQADIAAALAHASDAIWTNTAHHAQWLREQVRTGTPIHVQPVFSNIGEPARVPPVGERARQLVVFGSAPTRARCLRRLPRFAAVLNQLGIEHLVEVGSGPAAVWTCSALRRQHLGRLVVPALRQILEGSAYALVDCPSVYLGKSSVFAGYAAHGCVVLNTAEPDSDADGLLAGLHYQTLGQVGARWREQPQSMADAARAWYAQHPLAAQVEGYAALCKLPLSAQSAERGGAADVVRAPPAALSRS